MGEPAVLCCAVLCCAVLCCAVLCCAVLCCAVLCCAVLCCAVLCCAVLCWFQKSKWCDVMHSELSLILRHRTDLYHSAVTAVGCGVDALVCKV